MLRECARIFGFGPLQSLIEREHVGNGEGMRVGCPDGGCVQRADVFFERFRSAVSVVAAAACADLPSLSARPIEDDPASFVFSEPESWRLGFAARHEGITNLRIARGVVRFLPATLAISRVPAATAVLSDDNVSGPSGKKTATASISVITSSWPHCAGSGRALARLSLSTRCLGIHYQLTLARQQLLGSTWPCAQHHDQSSFSEEESLLGTTIG
jgi:hypothetical protein